MTSQTQWNGPLSLIARYTGPHHVSLDTVMEFEDSIVAAGKVTKVDDASADLASAIAYRAWRLQNRFGIDLSRALAGVVARYCKSNNQFVVLMGPHFRKCLPCFLAPGSKSIYLFDAWPEDHDHIVKFAKDFKVANVFITSSQSAALLQRRLPDTRCHWVAEAIDVSHYRFRPAQEKTIDVLALGRRYDAHHHKIVGPLRAARRNYLFETVKGQVVFPTREEFVAGLARSKISICVSSDITHPERAAGISTMTVRYLQSMASKCLVVGNAPAEMVELFGYDPVVPIDLANAADQLAHLLDNYSQHEALIERNYRTVCEAHTWHLRWRQIQRLLAGVAA